MITGSHMPADRNGIKFYRPDGEIAKEDELAIGTAAEEIMASSIPVDATPEGSLGPAAKRDAVAHLKAIMGLSERRACQIISADRKTIRYRSSRPPEVELRDLANERRQFGYR